MNELDCTPAGVSESCTITKVGLLLLKSPYTRIHTKNSAAAPTPSKYSKVLASQSNRTELHEVMDSH